MSLFKKTNSNSNPAVLAYLQTYGSKDSSTELSLSQNSTDQIQVWQPTKIIGHLIAFNDDLQQFKVFTNAIDKTGINYNYSDLISYELLENGNSITKGGLGAAAVGGILLGGTGAIVGSVVGKKKSETYATSLKIKITVNNTTSPTVWIVLMNGKLSQTSIAYRQLFNTAHEIISTLAVISESNKKISSNSNSEISAADEIRKYKGLLDDDIITQEEFDLKKKQLLKL